MRYDAAINQRFSVVQSSGDERVCPCPFHRDGGKPNLYVNARTGLYYCHACQAKGHVGKQQSRGSYEELATLKERIMAIDSADTASHHVYKESWLDRFNFVHDFWRDDRGFSHKTIARFRLGYDPVNDMLTIPIRDIDGGVMGVINRRTPEQVAEGLRPKYLHPKGFKMGSTLFGASLVRKMAVDKIAITEGPLDAIACWDASIPTVAMYGANLSEDQAAIIKGMGINTVVAMTDNDEAGDRACHTIKERLPGLTVLVAMYNEGYGKDPGELTRWQRLAMFDRAVPYHKAWA